jgi:hypothetical protein
MTTESVEELLLQMSDEELMSGGDQTRLPSVSLWTNRIVFDHLYRWDDVPDYEEED